MERVRRVDLDAVGANGDSVHHLFHGESCVIAARSVAAGTPAPQRHRAVPCDQVYFVVHGEMQLELGTEHHVVGPDTLVFIPQGLPHRRWNEGDTAELHLEVLAPAPRAGVALATDTDVLDTDLRATIVPVDPANLFDIAPLPGFRMNHLLAPGGLSVHAAAYVGEVDAESAGPPTHVHAFDQFYFVLEGEKTVDLALDRHTVGPCSLVAIPAGVPHTQWNDGAVMERHLAINCPAPPTGVRPDIGVTFAARQR